MVSDKPSLPLTINLSMCSIWSPWMSLAAEQASGVGKSILSLGVEEAVIPAVLCCPTLRSRPTPHRDVCCSTCFWSPSLPLKLDDFSDLLCSSLRVNVVRSVLQNSLSFWWSFVKLVSCRKRRKQIRGLTKLIWTVVTVYCWVFI